jgi:hypothetical protein
VAALAIFASTVTAAPFIASQAVTSVSPSAGPVAGGQSVVITGSGFTGASDVFFGATDALPCPASPCFTVPSDTEIDVTTPAGAAGTIDVTVKAGGVTSTITPADQYTYQQPVPTVTNVSPNAGPTAGGSPELTIAGTDFSGAGFSATKLTFGGTDVNFATGFPCLGSSSGCFQVNSATSISAFPPAGSGQVDITVTTASADGTSVQMSTTSPADTYVYAPMPSVTNVVPASGPVAGGNSVAISGTGFESTNGSGANFSASAVEVATTNVAQLCPGSPGAPCFTLTSPTQITLNNLPSHAAGSAHITVTTPGGVSATSSGDQYTYELLPSVTNVAPKAGPLVGGNTVTLTGADFTNATQVTVGTTTITTVCPASPCYTVNSATQVTVVMPPEPAATVNITVTTPGGTSAIGVANTYAYAPIPTIIKVNPNHGSIQGGADVTVTGTGFKSGTYYSSSPVAVGSTNITVTPCSGTVTAPCYNVNSATQIFIEDFPAHAAGGVDLTVTTVGGTSALSSADRYIYGATFPTVTSLSQRDGAQRGGEVVTIGGTNFTGQGFTTSDVIFSGSGVGTTDVPVTNPYPCPSSTTGCFSVVSASQISIFTPAMAASGTVDITVVTDVGTSGASTADQYTFIAPNAYSALSPFRVCDTRPKSPTPQCAGKTLGSKGTVAIQITGGLVPAGARAVVVNVTAINHNSTRTYLTAFPSGGSVPRASDINIDGGAILANLVIVQLNVSGGITIFNSVGSVDVLVDVQGYFAAPTGPGMVPGEFHGTAPFRICDTLANTHTACAGAANNPLPGKTWRLVGLAGTASIPSMGAAAAVFNLTATQETTSTFLTVTSPNGSDQCPTGQPPISNLNVKAAQNVPIRVISQLGPHNDICVYNAVGSANFIIDVNGWFGTGSEATAGALFYSVAPTRICDTRSGSGTECAGKPLSKAFTEFIPVAGVIVVPAKGASTPPIAVVANLTGVSGTASTFFTLYPSDLSRPGTSDLNPSASDVIANLAIVRIATTGGLLGDVSLYNAAGSINALLDVAGWFQQ